MAEVLVLGLGNLLLGDDAVGLCLLEELRRHHGEDNSADFVDGGTQGLALLGYLSGRRSVLVLDAVGMGAFLGLEAEPPDVTVIGVEPARVATGIGLSPAVEAAVPLALAAALGVLKEMSDVSGDSGKDRRSHGN